MLGGGFGRRNAPDYVRQAVQIARQMPGTPVKLLWSREEDMTHGRYHPVTQCKLTGAFDADNNLTGLHMRISGQSVFASITPQVLKDGMDPFTFQGVAPSGEAFANVGPARLGYTIPHLLIDHSMRNPHVRRCLARRQRQHNGIYLESSWMSWRMRPDKTRSHSAAS